MAATREELEAMGLTDPNALTPEQVAQNDARLARMRELSAQIRASSAPDLPPVDLSAAEPAKDYVRCALCDGGGDGFRFVKHRATHRFICVGCIKECIPVLERYGDLRSAARLASEGRGAETGWLTMTAAHYAEATRLARDPETPTRIAAALGNVLVELDRLRAALTAAEAERKETKRSAENLADEVLRLDAELAALRSRCREVEVFAREANQVGSDLVANLRAVTANVPTPWLDATENRLKYVAGRLSTLHEEGK